MIPRTNEIEVELSTKCTLSCSECPRVTHKDTISLWNDGFLKTKPFLDNIDSFYKNIMISGAYGDPIYHPDMADIFHHLVNLENNIQIRYETNGGYVSKEKWKRMAEALTSNQQYNLNRKEKISFSIDGSPSNFTKYRTNGDWEGTRLGLEIFGEYGIRTQWKFITFEFNTNFETLKSVYDTALQYNVDEIKIMHTTRAREGDYVSIDNFLDVINLLEKYSEDIDTNYVKPKILVGVAPGNRRYWPETEPLRKHKFWEYSQYKQRQENKEFKEVVSGSGAVFRYHNSTGSKTIQQPKQITKVKNIEPINVWDKQLYPQCIKNNWKNFIGGDGKLLPCCYLRAAGPERLQQTIDVLGDKWQDLSIYNNTISDIVKSDAWKILGDNLLSYDTCHVKCPSKDLMPKESISNSLFA